MKQVTRQVSTDIAIKSTSTLREVLIQVKDEWKGDFLMHDFRSGIRLSQRYDYNPETGESFYHSLTFTVSYTGKDFGYLRDAISLAESIAEDIEGFWKNPAIWAIKNGCT